MHEALSTLSTTRQKQVLGYNCSRAALVALIWAKQIRVCDKTSCFLLRLPRLVSHLGIFYVLDQPNHEDNYLIYFHLFKDFVPFR